MDFIKDLFREVQEDDLMGGAAELAYRFLFALFPFFLFMAALSAYITSWLNLANPTDQIIEAVSGTLPADAAGILETQLAGILEEGRPGLLSIGAVTALWAASSGTKSLMKWMNRTYNVTDDRPFLKRQIVGVGLTLLGAVGFLVGVGALLVGQVAGQEIASAVGFGETGAMLVSWARIPVVLVLLMLAMAVVYWLAPNADLPFKWITPGAAMFVVIWIAVTIAFGVYVANFANYQATYGALGAVIILMVWLYMTSFVILLGGKVNAVIQAREQQTTEKQTDSAAIEQRNLDPNAARRGRVHGNGAEERPRSGAVGAVSSVEASGRGHSAGVSRGSSPDATTASSRGSTIAERSAIAALLTVLGARVLRRIVN